MLRKIEVEVETELGLSEDQKDRVVQMVTGEAFVDHHGRYIDASGEAHSLSRVRFTCDATQAVEGSETKIDGVDSLRFPSAVHVILEDTEGKRTGMNAASCETKASWHYGLLFEVDGEFWFAGRDNPGGDEVSAQEPILKRVGATASGRPGDEPMALAELAPCDGEFWLTHEDEPSVVSIPWMSSYSTEPDPKTGLPSEDYCRAARAVLDGLTERVRALEASPAP